MTKRRPGKVNAIVWYIVIALCVFAVSAAVTTYLLNKNKTGAPSEGERAQVSVEPIGTPTVPRDVTIFMPKRSGSSFYLAPQTVATDKPGAEADVALDALLEQGQNIVESVELIPKGTKRLQPVAVDKGVATIDLSSEFVDGFNGGAEQESITLNSIAHTLAACKESKISSVRVLVKGKSVDTLGGHLDLTEPFEPLPDLLKPGG